MGALLWFVASSLAGGWTELWSDMHLFSQWVAGQMLWCGLNLLPS